MEKYPKPAASPYYYTTDYHEIPQKIHDKMVRYSGIDFNSEGMICCCWMENILNKGEYFVIITPKRIISRDIKRLEECFIGDIMGIERDYNRNAILRVPGNSFIVFSTLAWCNPDLMDRMTKTMNDLWLKAKEAKSAPVQAAAVDVVAQIEKLMKLKEMGAITDEEFAKMKADYLTKM